MIDKHTQTSDYISNGWNPCKNRGCLRSAKRGSALIRAGIFSTIALCLGLSTHVVADDWPAPQVREVFSANRSYFIRITPGESWGETWGFAGQKVGKHAQAQFFSEQPDKSYRLEGTIDLPNPVAPVDFFVSNKGDLVTVDNWHNRGYGAVLVLVHSNGKLVKAYKLADLFPKKEIDSFSQSVSSILWHKGPTFINEEQNIFYMGYREPPDYRELILKLKDGSVTLCARPPLIQQKGPRCWSPPLASSN
jgi:hypothetical protein